MELNTIPVNLDDFKNAPNGSLLIKQGSKWIATNKDELLKELDKRCDKLESVANDLEPIKRANVLLTAQKKKTDNLLDNLVNVLAWLVYERLIDNGVLNEQIGDEKYYEKVLQGNIKDLPSEYKAILNGLVGGNDK